MKAAVFGEEKSSDARRLHEVDLWEISIVTSPMLAQARVEKVKRAPVSIDAVILQLARLKQRRAAERFEAKLLSFSLERRYAPDQPRVPAGSPDGGQWTSGGAFSGGGFSGARDRTRRRDQDRVQTALSVNPRAASDADNSITPAQARGGGGRPPNLPSARQDPSLRRDDRDTARQTALEAFNRVRSLDPRWKAPQWIYDPERKDLDREIEFWNREERRALAREHFFLNAQKGQPRGIPSREEYRAFGARIRKGLNEVGLDDAEITLRGCAVSGERFATREPFDADSDFDVGVITPRGMRLAEILGFELRGRGGRTKPLSLRELERLGLEKLVEDLTRVYGRKVSLMFYQSADDVISRPGPYMIAP